MHNLSSGGLEPGKPAAVTALIMGILSLACLAATWAGMALIFCLLTLAFAIIGLVEASKAKRQGYFGALRTVGFSLSLLGLLGGVLLTGLTLLGIAAIFGSMGA